ncbi:MAG TPA: BTAD domain-containing putative transcriptional regulator [Acidimicrobiales bacterium]
MTDDRQRGASALADPEHGTSTAQVKFTALRGGVGVIRDGEPVAIGGPQQQRLLAALLAAQGAAVSADRLADTIWPEGAAPDGARRSVMTYVSRLRAAVGGAYVVTGPNGYQLVFGDASYDAAEFEDRLAVARASSGAAAIAAYDHALSLWSGRAFGDDGSEWWLSPVATRLEELRLVAHEERCELLIDEGRHAEAVADLQGLIADQPLREQFIALEMRALYLSGRQAEALRTYRRFADYLAEDTGLDPSQMLMDLEHRILIGDPSLAPSSAVAVPGYELGDLIGEGAFGAVYRAVQPSLDREVAVKAIRAELADDPRFVQRFETEAQLVARLEHPHVVPLYDFWRQPGAAFLVFRLLRGGSLAERIGHGPLGLAEVSRMVGEIGGALAAAHALGIVHRDVKPANVLFDESGNSYLADFGIADRGGDVPDAALRSAGSPLYASPEQARDGVAGQASDQYSLAVVAWEALAGVAPFAGTTATEVIRTKFTHTLPPLSTVSDSYAALDAILQKASAPVPVDRYRDITEFVHAWATACAGADIVRTTGSLSTAPAAIRAAGTLASLSVGAVNPYKGLRAFREADAAEFQGRTGLVDALVERAASDTFVLVVGPSGSGKSSLVHAGAVPALRRRDALVVSMVPSVDPFDELEAALRRVATTEIGDIAARLVDRDGLADIAADITTGDRPLVLVIDQFEELWTLVESDTVRDRFAASIAATLDRGHDICIIATLRADLYDRPLQHPVFGPIVRDATFAVTPMTSTELHDAITLPAERAGVRFAPGLVTTMVGDVVTRPGALPLLQFALTELFEQRVNGVVTTDAYHELGGIGGAIARRAEQLYDDTPTNDRDDVRLLFTQLVTPGDDNDDLRRRATREELAGVAPTVIDRFLTHRLLVTDIHPVTREPFLEVAHEALLREWPRLVEWIDQDRDTIRLRRALHTAAHDWNEHNHDEAMLFRGSRLIAAQDATRHASLTPDERDFLQASHDLDQHERTQAVARAAQQARQNKRLQRLLVAVAAVLVFALAAGFLAYRQRNRANDQADAARTAQAEAEQAGEAAQQARDEAETQRAAAESARNEALARGLAAQSTRLLLTNDNDLALLLAVESQRFAAQASPDSTATGEARASLLRALSDDPLRVGTLDVPDGAVFKSFELPAGTVDEMLYSPDGRTFAAVTQRGDVRLWDADTGQLHRVQPDPVLLSFNGPFAMSNSLLAYHTFTSKAGPTALWDINAQAPSKWQPPGPLDNSFPASPSANRSPTLNLALSPNGLLARSFSGKVGSPQASSVEIWDTNTGAVVAGPIAVDGVVDAMGFSDDGARLAVSATEGNGTLELEMFDTRTGTSIWRAVAHPGSTTDSFVSGVAQAWGSWVRFSDDGRRVSAIVSRSTVGAIATLDAATGTLAPSTGVGRDRTVMAVSDDLRYLILAAGAGDPGGPWGTVTPTEVVDANTGEVLASFETDFASLGREGTMPIRPNSTEFAIQRNPGRIIVRDWASVGVEPYAAVTPEQRFGPAVAVQLDGDVIDLTEPLSRLGFQRGSRWARWAWAASESGQIAITTDATIEIWDPNIKRFVRSVDKPTNCSPWYGGPSMAFTGTGDDGSVVVKCDQQVMSWDLGSPGGAPRWAQPVPNHYYNASLLVSPDGSRVVAPTPNSLQLLDGATGELIGEGFGAAINVAFSPDGTVVAAVSWPGDVTLFDADHLKPIKTLKPSGGAANDGGVPDGSPVIAISPDNEYVAAWHWDSGVEVWNVESGDSVAVIDGRRDYRPGRPGDRAVTLDIPGVGIVRMPLVALSFDDEGTGLDLNVVQNFTAEDGSLYHRSLGTQWSLGDDDLIETACRIVGRDLTEQEWAKYIGDSVAYRATCSPA